MILFFQNFSKKISQRVIPFRVFSCILVFVLLFIVLSFKLFNIQISDSETYLKAAINQQTVEKELKSKRGEIYFKDKEDNLIPAAINKEFFKIYAVPIEIQQTQTINSTAQKIAEIFNQDKEELIRKFSKQNDQYEEIVLKTNDNELIQKIQDLNLPGIYVSGFYERFYPLEELACHVLGFVGENKNTNGKKIGLYGLEKFYDDILQGKEGSFKGKRDALGRLVRTLFSNEESSLNGSSLITTIDKNVQYKAEKELESLIIEREAISGSVIIMDAKTGAIITMANFPKYDLNNYSQVPNYSYFKNLSIEEGLEIGSVVKVITMAAGLDSYSVTPDTTYDDKGYVVLNTEKIHNYEKDVYGKDVSMSKILEKSINTGAIFVQQQIGNQLFLDYLKKFGFDSITGIDLPLEINSSISNLTKKDTRNIYFATAAYGHGITLSSIALLKAYGIIANNGLSVDPYIVEAIMTPDGKIEKINRSEIKTKQVISTEAVKQVTDMMVNVVKHGYGKNAQVKGYHIAGKTGTADIASQGGYSQDTIQTFAGFFPAYKPRFVMMVRLDRPLYGVSASSTVTLTFRNLVKFLINYYNIPLDEENI
jgi:cell division protein FtsI/penicillin-binding protein 2